MKMSLKIKLPEMRLKLLLTALIITNTAFAQIPTKLGFALSDEFSERISIVKAQEFLLKEVLKSKEEVVQFELDLIASSMTGDMTALFYRCNAKKEEGLILAFYGDYWNDAGDIYKGYVFKNLPAKEAIDFLDMITRTIEDQNDFLSKNNDNNSSFQYDDLIIVLSKDLDSKIKIYWNGFDADWDNYSFNRTRRVLKNSLK